MPCRLVGIGFLQVLLREPVRLPAVPLPRSGFDLTLFSRNLLRFCYELLMALEPLAATFVELSHLFPETLSLFIDLFRGVFPLFSSNRLLNSRFNSFCLRKRFSGVASRYLDLFS